MAALLGQIGRCQVNRDAFPRQTEADGMQRIAHPLTAFGDRLVGQTDDRKIVLAAADPRLDLDRTGFNTDKCERGNATVHKHPGA